MSEIEETQERNHGDQPLIELMQYWDLTSHDLVTASLEQLTHKQVQRARQGRQLTLKMMQKVTRALNVAIWNRLNAEEKEEFVEYMHKHLFNYAKGYDPNWVDTNQRQEV